MKNLLLAVSLSAIGLTSAFAEEIPIVGLDKNHKAFLKSIPSEEYQARLATMILGADANIQPVLKQQMKQQSCSFQKKQNWLLRTVAVGIGLGIEGGLGPIVNAGAKTRIRLIYSNSTHPVFPD